MYRKLDCHLWCAISHHLSKCCGAPQARIFQYSLLQGQQCRVRGNSSELRGSQWMWQRMHRGKAGKSTHNPQRVCHASSHCSGCYCLSCVLVVTVCGSGCYCLPVVWNNNNTLQQRETWNKAASGLPGVLSDAALVRASFQETRVKLGSQCCLA